MLADRKQNLFVEKPAALPKKGYDRVQSVSELFDMRQQHGPG
jgi:hypothetical protein